MITENIYILSTKDSSNQEFIKIGLTSSSPTDRIKGLQTGCPFPLTLKKFYTIPSVSYGYRKGGTSCSKIEKILHDSVSAYNVSGEWFKMTEEAWQILNHTLGCIDQYESKLATNDAREKIEHILNGEVNHV